VPRPRTATVAKAKTDARGGPAYDERSAWLAASFRVERAGLRSIFPPRAADVSGFPGGGWACASAVEGNDQAGRRIFQLPFLGLRELTSQSLDRRKRIEAEPVWVLSFPQLLDGIGTKLRSG